MGNIDGFSLGLERNCSESFEMFIRLSSNFLGSKKIVLNLDFQKTYSKTTSLHQNNGHQIVQTRLDFLLKVH